MENSKVSLCDLTTVWRDENAKSIGYFSRKPLRAVDKGLIGEIKNMALDTGENVRFSLHGGPEDQFHEMIIFQHGNLYYPPKKHLLKDKSFHMLDGEMGVFVFTDNGEVMDAAKLSLSNRPIYRVGRDLFHTDIPVSEYVIHHESTLGPFLGEKDRIFAPWSTKPSNKEEFLAFREKMITQLEEF